MQVQTIQKSKVSQIRQILIDLIETEPPQEHEMEATKNMIKDYFINRQNLSNQPKQQ